jgi:hypothetical protein
MKSTILNLHKKFWIQFEYDVTKIVAFAINKLVINEKVLPLNEDEINRRLLFYLREANFELLKSSTIYSDLPPIYECSNQPIDDKERERKKWENKRPDFQFQKTDIYSTNPKNSTKYYVIECKRLGRPSSNDWILNLNYVINGIKRFISDDWRYGQGSPSGLMIGYIQNMEVDEIYYEIADNIKKYSLPSLTVLKGNCDTIKYKYSHLLTRNFELSKFTLNHIWIDIRDKYV